jgi:hypothetical protein
MELQHFVLVEVEVQDIIKAKVLVDLEAVAVVVIVKILLEVLVLQILDLVVAVVQS